MVSEVYSAGGVEFSDPSGIMTACCEEKEQIGMTRDRDFTTLPLGPLPGADEELGGGWRPHAAAAATAMRLARP
jgi:hypothetical protein